MRETPNQRNRSLRCDYHRDHDHETNSCQSLKFLIEKLIWARHLRRYIREPTRGTKMAPTADRAIAGAEHPSEPRPTINFILGDPTDDQYQSKQQRRRMLRAVSARARINTVSTLGSSITIQQVDGPISFPSINPTRSSPLIMMHLCLLCLLTILMCTGFLLILVAQQICCIFRPSNR